MKLFALYREADIVFLFQKYYSNQQLSAII